MKGTIPRQTQMTRSPRSMLPAESLDTAAQNSGQKTKSDGTDIVQKTILTSPRRGCLLILCDAIRPPDNDTMYQGSSKRESGQCSNENRKNTICSRLVRLTGRRLLYTAASSSSVTILMTSPTSGFETAWRPYSTRYRPSNSRIQPSDILVRSRTVSGAR